MRRFVKFALIAGACAVLMGCPKATSVTGRVAIGLGALGGANISVGDTLTAGDTYYVDSGASITVTYDNGKSCTFTGPTEFIPGNDGSVCEKKDNDDNKDRRDDQDKDKKEDQQEQQQEQQGQDQNQPSDNGENGANGSEGSSGINAPQVTPTPVPQYPGGEGGGGGIGGPQVIASGVPQYTSGNFIATGTQLLEAVVGIAATTKIGDELDDNDHKDNSGGGGNQPPPLSQ